MKKRAAQAATATPRLIDGGKIVERLIKMQKETTVEKSDAWYAVNRAIWIVWNLEKETPHA